MQRDKVDQVYRTLSYVDGMNFAVRAKRRIVLCWPDGYGLSPIDGFGAYNHWAGPKEITVWPFNQHNGGETFQTREKIRFVQSLCAREPAVASTH